MAAPRASGALRRVLPEPLGPEVAAPMGSLWSFEMAAPKASAPSLWSLEMAAPRASGAWGFDTAASTPQSTRLEEAVEEPVEEISKLFEAPRLEATSLNAL